MRIRLNQALRAPVAVPLFFCLFGIWRDWNGLQWLFCAGLNLALVVFSLTGRWAWEAYTQRFLRANRPAPFFLSVLLGQGLLLTSVLCLPKFGFGYFPLTVALLLALLGAGVWRLKLSSPQRLVTTLARELTQPIPAAGWVTIVIGTVFFARHFGPAGHDTLHHLYWARQIFQEGFIPLTAWHTTMLDIYPRGLPSLIALWGAVGGANEYFLGPYLKAQPFLQTALCVFAAAEIFSTGKRETRLSEFVVTLGALFFLFSWFPAVVPQNVSLDAVARYGSIWLFALPCLFAMQAFSPLYILLICGSLMALYNPASFVQFWPMAFVFCWGVRGWRRIWPREHRTKAIGLCVLVCALVLFRDPWVLNRMASAFPGLNSPIEWYAGAQTAVSRHGTTSLSAPAELSQPALNTKQELVRAFEDKTNWLTPFYRNYLNASKQALFWILIGIGWVGLLALRKPLSFPLRLTIATYAALLSSRAVFEIVHAFGRGFEFRLLANYSADIPVMWTAFLFPACLFSVLAPLAERKSPMGLSRIPNVTVAFGCLMACILLSIKHPDDIVTALPSVDLQQIRELRRIESQMAEGERLAAAFEISKQGERWIGPQGELSPLLVFANRPIVFFSYLGAGAEVSGAQLERLLCADRKTRRALLDRLHVYRFYFREAGAQNAGFFESARLCGKTLEEFGLTYPASYGYGINQLFALAP